MSDDNAEQPSTNKKSPASMKDDWGSSLRTSRKALFDKKDFDIFCDREMNETFIFYNTDLHYSIDYLEYNPENQRVTVFTTDGQQLDLGTRIQWLIRPYFAKPQIIIMARTKNGKVVEGFEVRLKVKTLEEQVLN
ncbi:MAG: hypothetical protein H6858_01665 [Rhodospirillales bacterium]|nr:hypothetical protein [Alphaproteobacteria bacterium]MCB9976290.1 hypothetical protein [Rhodospirillales bacterium]